jgi:hypothetical protein
MQNRLTWIAFGMAAVLSGCSNSPVDIVPPRIPESGRIVSIAVAPTDAKRMVVASETGGLFRTFNGGQSWQHLDGLPNRTADVAIASLDPNTIIATTSSQYHTVNDGGIWRSTDGGGNWSQPTGWAPPPGPDCPARPGAFGISHMPLSRTFYVGTDCGIAVSTDNGATWSHFVLDPTATGTDALQHRVRSLLVINRTSGVAAADRGLFFLSNGVWTKAQDVVPVGQTPGLHAFAAPFWNGANVFFHASGGAKLWLSTDGGATWSQIPAPSEQNREPFVRVARSISGDDRKIDVYFGDGINLHRQSFSFPGPHGSGSWSDPDSDHTDPSDVAFDLERRIPVLLATDGGVHVTKDKGSSWKLTGSGFGGLIALQIADMTGQTVGGAKPHLDLYFGTQDNFFRASADGGSHWGDPLCCEGRFLAVEPTSTDHQGTKVTGLDCGHPVANGCATFVTDAHFAHFRRWPDAPAGHPGTGLDAPFHLVEDVYLQYVANDQMPATTFDAFLTLSAGSAWSKTFSLPVVPKGPAIFAGSPANPTVFQGVQRPGAIPNGGPRFGLIRVKNLAGQAVVASVDTSGIGGLGSERTPVSRRVVFGVDPKDANHLIAADVTNGAMKLSVDGGDHWFSYPPLTKAVTDNGKFIFTVSDRSLPTSIAWDPYDSCHILIGTMQNGVIRSTDGGSSWSRIAGSEIVTEVSSFFFPPTGVVWASTDGRGLWTLDLGRPANAPPKSCRFPSPPLFPPGGGGGGGTNGIDPATGGVTPFSGLGDPSVCPRCQVVVVRNGWVTGLQMAGDELRSLSISGGTISALDRSGREVAISVPNGYRPGEGRFALGKARLAADEAGRIRGLVLEGNRVRRLIAASDELPFAPARTPRVFALGMVAPGGQVKVTGADFLPPSRGGGAVRILFGGEVVAPEVPVRADGSFAVVVPVHQPPGEVVVTAEQQDGLRLTKESTLLEIVRREALGRTVR